MKLVTEVSVALDGKRSLWMVTTADGVEQEDVETTVESMANAMLGQAMQAAEITKGVNKPSEPRMPPTFQEDE